MAFIKLVRRKKMLAIKALFDRYFIMSFHVSYFRGHSRTEVRKKALDVLSLTLSINTHVYEVS